MDLLSDKIFFRKEAYKQNITPALTIEHQAEGFKVTLSLK